MHCAVALAFLATDAVLFAGRKACFVVFSQQSSPYRQYWPSRDERAGCKFAGQRRECPASKPQALLLAVRAVVV